MIAILNNITQALALLAVAEQRHQEGDIIMVVATGCGIYFPVIMRWTVDGEMDDGFWDVAMRYILSYPMTDEGKLKAEAAAREWAEEENVPLGF